jgi:hypothetical protein
MEPMIENKRNPFTVDGGLNMLDRLKITDYTAHLKEQFLIHVESSEPLEVELVDVTELGSEGSYDPESSKRRPFSVVFRASEDIYLPQQIYRVEHEKMGTLDLFLVPIGPDKEGGMRYEAVFN